jgi:predicted RNase H-like HicB family nuclease
MALSSLIIQRMSSEILAGVEGKDLALGTLNAIRKKAGLKWVSDVIHWPLNPPGIHKESTSAGYSADSPDVPGCAAVGDTAEETRHNFQDALAAHFEVMREIGEPIPEPHSAVDYVEVAA